jgi:site-specific DNA recombinase
MVCFDIARHVDKSGLYRACGVRTFHYLPPKARLRSQRGRSRPSSRPVSRIPAPCEEWIDIPVTAIVEAATFEAVRAQLAENKIRKRDRETGHVWLLQGLTVCRHCGYAYYGKGVPRTRGYDRTNLLRYYRCVGGDGYRFQGQALCWNPPVRADQLEEVVWDRVRAMLQEPERVADEYKRRLALAGAGAEPPEEVVRVEKQMASLRRGIERIIDSYAEGFVEKSEFEPRITGMKQRMSQLKERFEAALRTAERERDIRLIVSRLEDFAAKVSDGLDRLDRIGQREIIRAMVKRIDVEQGEVEIVFRVPPPNVPGGPSPSVGGAPSRQHCTAVRRAHDRLARTVSKTGQGLGVPQSESPRFPQARLHPTYAAKAMQSKVMFADRWGDWGLGRRVAAPVKM